jgi:ssRNA-specific RNase YbeY (16S rRNA maturation enzyme)
MIGLTNTSDYPYPESVLLRAGRRVLRYLKMPSQSVLEIHLVSSRKMIQLNRHFRHKNHATTVLSFGGNNFLVGRKRLLGEVFLCPEKIRQAVLPQYVSGCFSGLNFRQIRTKNRLSLMYFLIHGILHLAGFDHEKSVVSRGQMEQMEKKIFCWLLKTK